VAQRALEEDERALKDLARQSKHGAMDLLLGPSQLTGPLRVLATLTLGDKCALLSAALSLWNLPADAAEQLCELVSRTFKEDHAQLLEVNTYDPSAVKSLQ